MMDTKSVFTKTFSKKKQEVQPENQQEEKPGPLVLTQKKTAKKAKTGVPKKEVLPANRASAMSFDSEHIVRSIHQEKELLQRITVDMPKEIYQLMKVHLAHENVSIRDFVVRLVDVYLTKNNIR